MRIVLILLPLALLPFVLSACGGGDTALAPGSVTQSEARELNEAAEMLDAKGIMLEESGNHD
jgi:hypothetical protein